MKSLTDIKPETKVTVKKIEGGSEVKRQLEDLGICEGIELNVMAQTPSHEHSGTISVKIGDREVALGHGVAEKIYMDKGGVMLSLLELEQGDKGVVRTFGGGKDFAGWLSELGINEGTEVEFLRHKPDSTLIFKAEDREIKMGEGQASKVMVAYEGSPIQINYLTEGEKANVITIIGGTSIKEMLEEMGLEEGAEITLIGKEAARPTPVRGKYVRAQLADQLITIGYGTAQKVWVE
jgi:Fe2+ transport system protein FeoA